LKYRDYVIKRIILLVPVIFGVSILTYALSYTVANPVYSYLGTSATKLSQAKIAEITKTLGLDKPWYIQYLRYVERIFLKGDWGRSNSVSKQPILQLLAIRFPATVELGIMAMVIGVSLGIPLGIISAIRQDRAADHVARIFALSGVSMPIFWFGILLQIFISNLNHSFAFLPNLPYAGRYDITKFTPPTKILFGMLPATGFFTVDSLLSFRFNFFVDVILHLIPPAIVLSLGAMAILSRMTRMSMVEVLRQDYILLAKSKGLRERVILYRHAFRNAILPTLTIAGLALAGLLTGAVLTEDVFSWPGIGLIAAQSIISLDLAALQGFVILTAFVYVISNLLIDLFYGLIDPRIRYD